MRGRIRRGPRPNKRLMRPFGFNAAEIGLRGTLSPDPKDPRTEHFEVRIDAKDVALAHQEDQYTGQLRLAMVGYLADGQIERLERRADQEGGPKAAIHSGLESALGSHPCVALSSYQAFRLYGKCRVQ